MGLGRVGDVAWGWVLAIDRHPLLSLAAERCGWPRVDQSHPLGHEYRAHPVVHAELPVAVQQVVVDGPG